MAVVTVIVVYFEGTFEGYSATYPVAYAEQIDAGKSEEYARAYAEQIEAGLNERYAEHYAGQISDGESPIYARAYAEQISDGQSSTYARAYAEQIDAGHLYWYADTYAREIDAGKSPARARAYAKQIDDVEPSPRAYAGQVDLGDESSEQAIDATVVLAMYSTMDDAEAESRATSVREMTIYAGRGDMDKDTVLGLLNDIAPEASIDERRKAADGLASISEDGDGELTPEQSMQVANELTRLITGHGIDAEQRTEAAREMVRLSQSGELNVDNAAELMDTIAPEWSVAERKEALGYLTWQFSHGEWDAGSTKRTAEEGYMLITGGEIQLEKRIGAGVEVVGESLKRFGGDGYDDESVDMATDLIKVAISGDLSTDSVSKILGLDGQLSASTNTAQEADAKEQLKNKIYKTVHAWAYTLAGEFDDPPCSSTNLYSNYYAGQYAHAVVYEGKSSTDAHKSLEDMFLGCYGRFITYLLQIDTGKTEAYARAYVEQIDAGVGKRYARAYAEQIDAGKTEAYARAYVEQIDAGVGKRYARAYAEQIDAGKTEEYAHTYAKHMDIARSRGYVRTYVEQIVAGRSEEYAHAYAKQRGAGRSRRYAAGYALARVTEGMDLTSAHAYAHAYTYAQFYGHAERRISNYWPSLGDGYGIYSKPTYIKHPESYARAYAEQIIAGKWPTYANAYAKQIDAGKSPTYANAYVKQRGAGRSPTYSSIYAWFVDL